MGLLQTYLKKLKDKRFQNKVQQQQEDFNEESIKRYNIEARKKNIEAELLKEKQDFLLR